MIISGFHYFLVYLKELLTSNNLSYMKKHYSSPYCETVKFVSQGHQMITGSVTGNNAGYPVVPISDPFSSSTSPTGSFYEQLFSLFNE